MRQFSLPVVLLLFAGAVAPSMLAAQSVADSFVERIRLNESGNLSGSVQFQFVTGKTQAIVSQVQLLRGPNLIAKAKTNQLGEFEFSRVMPGPYVMRATTGEQAGSLPIRVYPEQTEGVSPGFVGTLTHSSQLVVSGGLDREGEQSGVSLCPNSITRRRKGFHCHSPRRSWVSLV